MLANIFYIATIVAGVIYYFRSYEDIIKLNRTNQLFSKLGLLSSLTMLLAVACMVVGTVNLIGK